MSTRRHTRQTARQNRPTAHSHAPNSVYRRPLRFEPLEDRRLLAVITVNTLSDVSNDSDGVTTLREAIVATNLGAGADTIQFAPNLTANGPTRILLKSGELKITDSLTVEGPGSAVLTIDATGNAGARIFNIDDGQGANLNVSISGLTLTGGRSSNEGGAITSRESFSLFDIVADRNNATAAIHATLTAEAQVSISNSVVSNNVGRGISISTVATNQVYIDHTQVINNSTTLAGGGINVIGSGKLSLDHSLISGNVSQGNAGGGIRASISGTATVNITDCEILNNTAGYGGGVSIEIQSQSPAPTIASTIVRSTISGNVVTQPSPLTYGGRGGGIHFSGVPLYFSDLIISDNTAQNGGGMYINNSSGFVVERCSIVRNVASSSGGGLVTASIGTFRQSTFSGNSAPTGGAISSNSLALEFSTVAGNDATTSAGGIRVSGGILSLDHSIIADNSGPSSGRDISRSAGALVIASYSLIGDGTGTGLAEVPVGSPDLKGNLIGGPMHGAIDPLLRPLADYFGTLPTRALAPGSPAINGGNPAAMAGVGGVPQYDQRGDSFTRVSGGRIDLGAFEFQTIAPTELVVDSLTDELDMDYSPGDLSLREALRLANLAPDTNTIRFSPLLFATGPATLVLTRGALDVVGSVSIVGAGQTLLTIDASGSDLTPDVADAQGDNAFTIHDEEEELFDVAISGLTLTGGDALYGGAILSTENLSLQNCTITGNHAQELGGGLAVLYGNVTIDHCVITNNATSSELSTGGGIAAASAASLHITNSTIAGNTSAVGGGIHAFDTPLDITNSNISDNTALGDGGAGGGIYQKASTLTLADSIVSGNTSISGGGIYVDGAADITRTNVTNNYAYFHGGGIYSFGSLQLLSSTITSNSAALDGGGLHASGDMLIDRTTFTENTVGRRGGAAWIEVVDGTLALTNSTLTKNFATNEGGAAWITAVEGPATIAYSNIDTNTTDDLFGLGGALTVNAGSVAIDHTTVTNNLASSGGGIYNRGDLSLTDTTVTINTATFDGGGIFSDAGSLTLNRSTLHHNAANRSGGGIYSKSTAHITSSTIGENTADELGGGLVLYSTSTLDSQSTIRHSTIAKNYVNDFGGGVFLYTGPLSVDHSIIAENLADAGLDLTGFLGSSFDAHFSLIGNNTNSGLTEAPLGSPDANGNLIGGPNSGTIDPKLGQLAIYAGATATYPLPTGSPAINAGNPAAAPGVGGVPQFDQRGAPFTRVSGGRIDIGALESQSNPLPGDFNFNNTVDAADYIIWRKTVGSLTDFRADSNGDQKVDNTDYNIWRSNFGKVYVPPGGAGVASGAEMSSNAAPASDSLPIGEAARRSEGIESDRLFSAAPRARRTTEALPSATTPTDALLNCLATKNQSSDPSDAAKRALSATKSSSQENSPSRGVDTDVLDDVITNWPRWR